MPKHPAEWDLSHLIDPEEWDEWIVYRLRSSLGVEYTAVSKRSCVAYVRSEVDVGRPHCKHGGPGYYLLSGTDGLDTRHYRICRTTSPVFYHESR